MCHVRLHVLELQLKKKKTVDILPAAVERVIVCNQERQFMSMNSLGILSCYS